MSKGTPDMFTLDEARRRRDEALKAVERNASKTYKDALRYCVLYEANTKGQFSADDVWEQMSIKFPDLIAYAEEDPRALGAIMVKLAKDNLIAKSGQYTPSVRRHCTPITVWRAA